MLRLVGENRDHPAGMKPWKIHSSLWGWSWEADRDHIKHHLLCFFPLGCLTCASHWLRIQMTSLRDMPAGIVSQWEAEQYKLEEWIWGQSSGLSQFYLKVICQASPLLSISRPWPSPSSSSSSSSQQSPNFAPSLSLMPWQCSLHRAIRTDGRTDGPVDGWMDDIIEIWGSVGKFNILYGTPTY